MGNGSFSPVEYLFAELVWLEESTGLTVIDESRFRVGVQWRCHFEVDMTSRLYKLGLLQSCNVGSSLMHDATASVSLSDFGFQTIAYRLYHENVRACPTHPDVLESIEAYMLYAPSFITSREFMVVRPFLRPSRILPRSENAS